jgi:hypothetical protein
MTHRISTDSQQLARTTFVQCIDVWTLVAETVRVCVRQRHVLLAQTTDSAAGLLSELTGGML